MKCVNIHNGTDGELIEIEGIRYVEFKRLDGIKQRVPFSDVIWKIDNDDATLRKYPKALMVRIAFTADTALMSLLGMRRTHESWEGIEKEKKRRWIESGVTTFAGEHPEYKQVRIELFESIMKALELLWKEE